MTAQMRAAYTHENIDGGLELARAKDGRVELTTIGHVARYDLHWTP